MIRLTPDSKVIVPRRNFFIRALGFTAAGTSMVLPVIALQSPEERITHHFKELEAAFQDLCPSRRFVVATELNDRVPLALIAG